MPADYHTHTPLCFHAEGEPEEYIDAAIRANVSEYGISDHAPAQPEPFDDWRMLEADLPNYFEWINRAKAYAGDKLTVRVGLECDWLPGCEPWIENLKARYPWDYLIGSVHYIHEKWDFDNPIWIGRWAETDIEEAWTVYWSVYTDMVESGLFKVLGHPDLIKKFGYHPSGNLDRFYEPVIESIATSGAAIELNTAGWHKPCEEAYPHLDFLTLARDAGIPLIISSDAHKPSEVGRDFQQAIALAKQANYSETVLIQQDTFRYEPLP